MCVVSEELAGEDDDDTDNDDTDEEQKSGNNDYCNDYQRHLGMIVVATSLDRTDL